MTKSLQVLAFLSLAACGVTRRADMMGVRQETEADAFQDPSSMAFVETTNDAEIENMIRHYTEQLSDIGSKEVLREFGVDQMSEATAEAIVSQTLTDDQAQKLADKYEDTFEEIGAEKVIKDVGTQEVLHEHGMDQISDSEAEVIVNAAEGMVRDGAIVGKSVSDGQARKIVEHYEKMLEQIGADKVINDAAKSLSGDDDQRIHGQVASQAASKKMFGERKATHPHKPAGQKDGAAPSKILQEAQLSSSEADAQKSMHYYESQLKSIGTKEVLHEHGMDQISDAEAEAIVNAAAGMVRDGASGGKRISDSQAQKIVEHYEKMLEEIGADKVINDATKSFNGDEAQRTPSQKASQAASQKILGERKVALPSRTADQKDEAAHVEGPFKLVNERAKKMVSNSGGSSMKDDAHKRTGERGSHKAGSQLVLMQFNSSSIHHLLCLQLKICSHKEGFLQKTKHGLAHIVHLDGIQSVSQNVSRDSTKSDSHKEGIFAKTKHGLAHIMHLDGSASHAHHAKETHAEGRFQQAKHGLAHILHLAGSHHDEAKKIPSDYAKQFSVSEAQKARKIINEYNAHEKSFGEYDKVITDSEAQKIVGDYEKMLAHFWDHKPSNQPEDSTKPRHDVQEIDIDQKKMQTEKMLANTGAKHASSAPKKDATKSGASDEYGFGKTFDDFGKIIDDIGSAKSKALYLDLLQSLTEHQSNGDSPSDNGKVTPPPEPAPAPIFASSLAQATQAVTENVGFVEKGVARDIKSSSETESEVVKNPDTDAS